MASCLGVADGGILRITIFQLSLGLISVLSGNGEELARVVAYGT